MLCFTAVTFAQFSMLTLAIAKNYIIESPEKCFSSQMFSGIAKYLYIYIFNFHSMQKWNWDKNPSAQKKMGLQLPHLCSMEASTGGFGKATEGHNFWFFTTTATLIAHECMRREIVQQRLKEKRSPTHHILLDLAVWHRYADGQLFWRGKHMMFPH